MPFCTQLTRQVGYKWNSSLSWYTLFAASMRSRCMPFYSAQLHYEQREMRKKKEILRERDGYWSQYIQLEISLLIPEHWLNSLHDYTCKNNVYHLHVIHCRSYYVLFLISAIWDWKKSSWNVKRSRVSHTRLGFTHNTVSKKPTSSLSDLKM